jgi:catechol 2,3-dioxygenase-like lactoylglutathione lyase family enzyme
MDRRSVLAALCGVLLSLPATVFAATVAPSGATLLRTTLTVADVDRSLAFYSLLGFSVESEMGGERNPDSPFPLNSKSTRWRLTILGPSSGEGGKIGLLSFDNARPAPTHDASREQIGLGDMVFVFDVTDAGLIHSVLQAAGARIVEDPVTYRSRNKDAAGRPMEGRVFHVFDPDGYLIEILQAPQPVSD